MKSFCETISDDNGIEINVSYEFDEGKVQIEECHGIHNVGNKIYTELKSVEVVFGGIGYDILNKLSENVKDFIIKKLNYGK